MKQFGILALLTVSAPAFACPAIAGKWGCLSSDGSKHSAIVTQENATNGVIYHIQNDSDKPQDFYADGVIRHQQDHDYSGTIVVSCKGDSEVDVSQTAVNPKQGFRLSADSQYLLTGARALHVAAHSSISFAGQAPQDSTSTATCQLE